jgi:hypothetical protein
VNGIWFLDKTRVEERRKRSKDGRADVDPSKEEEIPNILYHPVNILT